MDNFIAEYNNMWSKLNIIAEHHNNLFIFTLTSSGAILTYGIQQSNSYIALMNLIILILLRCRVMTYRDEYFQILAYIRKVLEPKLNIDSKSLTLLKNTSVANIQYFVYSILGFGTMITCVFINKNNFTTIVITISIILNIVIILLDIYYYFYNKKLYTNYEKQLSN